MAQNTPQDVSEEIIDLVEIIQKGKVPRPKEDASIDFDQALSDLHGGGSSAVADSPQLEDLLADLEPAADTSAGAPVSPAADAETSFDDLLAGLEMPTADPGPKAAKTAEAPEAAGQATGQGTGPAMPEVPSFESLFADLGLGGDSAPDPGKPAAPAPKPVQPAKTPEPSAAAEAMEQIPGFEDMDALISKLDVPPGGDNPKPGMASEAGALLNALGSNGAPADLDSLLDSLLTAGGPRAPQAKAAQGQPKEISEADLDDLLSSIEVESGGKNATPATPIPPPAPEPSAPPVESPVAQAEPAAQPLTAEPPAKPATPEASAPDSIDDLFKALDVEAPTPQAPAAPVDPLQDMDLDALLAGMESPTPPSPPPGTAAPATVPTDAVALVAAPDKASPDLEAVPAEDGDALATADAVATTEAPKPATAPAPEAEPVAAPESPAQQTSTPSLADLLSGKVELNVSDESDESDVLGALDALPGFEATADADTVPAVHDEAPDDVLADIPADRQDAAPAAVDAEPDVATAVEVVAASAVQDLPAASGPAEPLVESLTPEDVLADIDALIAEPAPEVPMVPAAGRADLPPLPVAPAPAAADGTALAEGAAGVDLERFEEMEQRMAMLEAELMLLQNRVDALETATESEQLQDKVLDALSDDTPLRVQLQDLVQTAAQQSAAGRDERMHKNQTEFEARVTALEERQRDVEWGREEGLTTLEKRLVALEGRLDASERLQALEERLALLERQPEDNLEERVSVLETLPVEALEERVNALESRRVEDLGQRLAQLEQHMQSLKTESPEEMTRKLVEAMRADIERAAAESAARVLREEIAALLNEH